MTMRKNAKPTKPRKEYGCVLENYPDEAAFLGMIIAEWNTVELAFTAQLADLMETKRRVVLPMVYALQNNRARLDTVNAAMRELVPHPADRIRLDSIMVEAHAVLKQRNLYTHGFYASGTGHRLQRVSVSDIGTKKAVRRVTPKELSLALIRVIELRRRVFAFGEDLKLALPPEVPSAISPQAGAPESPE
jgi:hypothetical protein